MTRKSTIAKRVAEIVELEQKRMGMESEAEAQFGYVPQSVEEKIETISNKADKKREEIIARLHADGLCSEDGVTSDEANHEIFEGIDSLHEIGNGEWC